jgi:arylsulfatase A-like enzyme
MRSLPALLTVVSAFLPTAPAVHAAAPPTKPNILLIVADDLGWADVGWHGSQFKTPHLDKLVREGVELDRHYVQTVCSPTRTALLSGRWTSRFGPHVLEPTNLRAFPPGTITLASALKQCGYATFLAGKWHLGSRLEWGPQHYGFDHSYGSLAGAVDPWEHTYRKGEYMKTWQRPAELKLDGLDIWPVLTGAVPQPAARTVYIPHGSGVAVYHGDWKLIARRNQNAKPELFNLGADPFEKTDLAAAEPERVKELQAILAELRKDDLTTLPADLARGPAKE